MLASSCSCCPLSCITDDERDLSCPVTILGFSSASEVYTYVTCVLLGISLLMPLNALTSAPSFMLEYYKYVTGDPLAQPNNKMFWANIFAFYNIASVVTQIACGPTVLLPCARKVSLTSRFIGSLVLMMSEVLVVEVMPAGHVSQTAAIVAFFIVTIAAGAGKSYLEATSYALVSSMPPKFMSAVMFGCGFSGVIASVLQCIVKVSMKSDYESVKTQSLIYFSLALGIMFLAMMMAISLRWNTYAQTHVAEFRVAKRLKDEAAQAERRTVPAEREPMCDENMQSMKPSDGYGIPVTESCDRVVTGASAEERNGPKDLSDEGKTARSEEGVEAVSDEDLLDQKNMTTAEQLQHTRVVPIIKLIYQYQIACFCIFFVSLFIFPSLLIAINRVDAWFPTIVVLVYNCGDATGRLSSSIKYIWPSKKVLLIVAALRFGFIPLIFLCIFGYIPGFVGPYIITFCISLTKGFFGAMSMVMGPITPGLKTEGQRVMAGQLMGISLLAGASVASLLALLVVLFLP